ncbi:MAG TPA: glycosyltransferase, partial [Xanthomonadales bacterium]|nr:glycosyltransferase [Xanthomonadales bacterium]
VKGYAELIQAWANLRPTGWKLAIAGPDEDGYRSKLEELIHKLQLQEAVVMLGEVDDLQKWTLLDQCELLVAPSKAENFGMAIAEALQSGTPVITTTGTPWRELQECDCGWWVAPDVVALERALEEATRMDAGVLRAKGARGQRLVEEKYSWDEVASRTVRLYQAIIARRAQ